jgi:hypothetical protein
MDYIGYVRMRAVWRPTDSGLVLPPATVVVSNGRPNPNGGADLPPATRGRKGASLALPERWLKAIAMWNPTRKGLQQVIGSRRGWVNGSENATRKISESVDFAGNISGVLRREGDWLELDALKVNSPIPDFSDRLHVHMLTAVTPFNQLRLFADGVVSWYPFLINGSAWVHINDVDFFTYRPEPSLPGGAPADLGGYPAFILRGTIIRQKPGGAKVTDPLASDLFVRVISEVNGWAKIGERRWVELDRVRAVG